MITRIIRMTSITLLFATVFSGCGGGGGGGNSIAPPPPPPPPPPPTGGIVRTGITSGVVSGFGSVFVNGVEYETDNATITVDDQPGAESDLKVGYVVQITGTVTEDEATGLIETGEADTIVFDDNVEGPIQSRDLANNSMLVMGQTVFVDADTSFDDDIDPPALEGLMDGEIVEVTGFINANGGIVATRIERKVASPEFEVRGVVSSLNAGAMTFNINALVVDFSAATLDNFPSGAPSDGDFVEAKGMNFGAGGELLATRVELEDQGLTGNEGDNAEIEGLITRFVSATDFDVAGFPVTTNAQTVFEGGTAQDLGLNVKVEAEGDIDANGVLVADKVDIRRGNVVRLATTVDDVDAAGGTVTILGIDVTVDALTRLEDKTGAVEPFTLADLNAGDFVEIRGAEDPPDSGMVVASRLERDDPDPDTILQGFVQSVTDPDLDILGVTVQTDPNTTIFRDVDDNVIDSSDFFNAVMQGSLVKAKGTALAGNVIDAEEVEFENQ